MSWDLVVKQKFSAAHFLKNYKGLCEKMHGHTFEIEVYLRVEELNPSGIAIDFTEIKKFLKELLPDHQLLNDVYDFSPSAENLSRHFFQVIKKRYPVAKVVIWESENARAEYAESE